MQIIDGKKIQEKRLKMLAKKIQKMSIVPHLAIIQIGDDLTSNLYIKNKILFSQKIGAKTTHVKESAKITTEDVCRKIEKLNKDKNVHGIIVQMPTPKHIDAEKVLNTINVKKDVDGLSSLNIYGLIKNKKDIMIPATAKGILSLIDELKISLEGKNIAVIGRSLLVGKSTGLALLNKNATITICHSQTKNLKEITKKADILIVAIGKKHFITDEFIGKNQIIIDVGINPEKELHDKTNFYGDVLIKNQKNILAMTPVPGGVGPMTVLSLFENLILAKQLLDQK
jgi:methylenetetrahydrofolate dehydrogenase (NADP+) / methenyltetrahydrofolate cyclohydrolase